MNEGYRKAALKLHSLSASDRNWMLQRLSTQERKVLSDLLRELQELGIKNDHRLADDFSQDEVRHALLQAGANVPGLVDALDALCIARPTEMLALLAAEPDNMTAIVLSIYPWPWHAHLQADYAVEKRQRISHALQQQAPQLKPRLRAELIKVLADRLAVQRIENPVFDQIVLREARFDRATRTEKFFQGLRRWLP